MEIVVTPSPSSAERCGFCREALELSAAQACARCGARFHAACAAELGRDACPTLGCGAAARRPPDLKARPSAWRRALRLLRAPLAGLLLGWVVVRGIERIRIAWIPPAERSAFAHAYCERADELSRAETARLGLAGPIHLPEEVMGRMIDEYSRALELDPDHLEALHWRAYWRWFSHDGRGARADYERLLARDPTNHEAWYQLGRLRCEGGEHERAVEAYSRAIEHQPRSQRFLVYRGARATCRREAGDLRGALEDLLADPYQDHLALADVLQGLGEHARALPHWDAWLQTSQAPELRWRRGLSRFAVGQVEAAREDFQAACAADGVSPSPRDLARERIAAHPGDPLSRLLEEVLAPRPERGSGAGRSGGG